MVDRDANDARHVESSSKFSRWSSMCSFCWPIGVRNLCTTSKRKLFHIGFPLNNVTFFFHVPKTAELASFVFDDTATIRTETDVTERENDQSTRFRVKNRNIKNSIEQCLYHDDLKIWKDNEKIVIALLNENDWSLQGRRMNNWMNDWI